MSDWGPADWYVVAGAGIALVGFLFGALWALPDVLEDWRESMRRLPESDERDRVPYRRAGR